MKNVSTCGGVRQLYFPFTLLISQACLAAELGSALGQFDQPGVMMLTKMLLMIIGSIMMQRAQHAAKKQ